MVLLQEPVTDGQWPAGPGGPPAPWCPGTSGTRRKKAGSWKGPFFPLPFPPSRRDHLSEQSRKRTPASVADKEPEGLRGLAPRPQESLHEGLGLPTSAAAFSCCTCVVTTEDALLISKHTSFSARGWGHAHSASAPG